MYIFFIYSHLSPRPGRGLQPCVWMFTRIMKLCRSDTDSEGVIEISLLEKAN